MTNQQKLEKIKWCIERHRETNHFYDEYLPYEFHLRMVAQVAKNFKKLIPTFSMLIDGSTLFDHIELACYGHDLIEDARTSYNDVKKVLGLTVADMIYAVTNEKGKERPDRANAKYYRGIRENGNAIFVKLCDRIANVQYSKMTKSSMFNKYSKENEHFMNELGYGDVIGEQYDEMFKYLIELFKD